MKNLNFVKFIKNKNDYVRDISVIKHYIEQASEYLSIIKDISVDEARSFIKNNIRPNGLFELKNPTVKYLERENNSDRSIKETTMGEYLKDSLINKQAISPTLTTYQSPEENQSLLALYTNENIKERSKLKKKMFKAKTDGNEVLYTFLDLAQFNAKITNNSLSGASLTPSTVLFNPTTHSTLTTMCRLTTAYGNANNEKFIEGNRHYYDVDVILNNIMSIITTVDLNKVEKAIIKYQLKYPTVSDVIDCINYSRYLYFKSEIKMEPVWELVNRLTPIQRAAFIYVGDFYQLFNHNPDFIKTLILDIIRKIESNEINNVIPVIDDLMSNFDIADEIISTFPSDILNLAKQICRNITKGKSINDIKENDPDGFISIALTAYNINRVLLAKQDFIEAFFLTNILPASVGNYTHSLRRSVLGGDTDSTLFTVQEWVKRILGVIDFSDQANNVSDVIIFLAAQSSAHLHALMSVNCGMDINRIFDTKMKNEYKFDVFVPTSMAKHYWALKTVQEGTIYAKPELELKGANLISSNTPGSIVSDIKEMLLTQMKDLVYGKKLYIKDVLKTIADKENEIKRNIESGSTDYFKTINLKTANAYKLSDVSKTPYWYHIFYNSTFGKIYGLVDEPPYTMIKIPLDVNNQTEFKETLLKMDNPDLIEDIYEQMSLTVKKLLNTIYIPVNIVQLNGIPKEIINIINVRKMMKESCAAYYHILEAYGLYMNNKRNTRMISDV